MNIYGPELYAMVAGVGLIGPAEFVQIPKHMDLINKAKELRNSPHFLEDVLPRVAPTVMWMENTPDDVLTHNKTPTYHIVIAVLLGADRVADVTKTRERAQMLKGSLESHLKESRRDRVVSNLHMALARFGLTGCGATNYPAERLAELHYDSIERFMDRLACDYATTRKHERAICTEAIAHLEEWLSNDWRSA